MPNAEVDFEIQPMVAGVKEYMVCWDVGCACMA